MMNFLRRYGKILAGLWLVSLLWWGVPRCLDGWQLEHRQMALLRAIEQRSPKVYEDLISPSYADDWQFTPSTIRKSFDDVSAQFLTLKIFPRAPLWSRSDTAPEATWTAKFTLTGKPITPVGEMILTSGSQLKTPFTFVWRKEGWGAWTWKLVTIRNPELSVPEWGVQ